MVSSVQKQDHSTQRICQNQADKGSKVYLFTSNENTLSLFDSRSNKCLDIITELHKKRKEGLIIDATFEGYQVTLAGDFQNIYQYDLRTMGQDNHFGA